MKVAIITEGYQGTGYGHLTRCLSIYQAFEEKNITPLYIANCDDKGKKFIPNVNLLQTNWLVKNDELIDTITDFDIAVIDSYLAPKELYERIYKTVKKAVYIDDYIRLDYPSGIIVNGTVGAENLPYKRDNEHEYLLGIDYMPLRKEFWDVDTPKRNGKIGNVLLTFGAQDFRNLTPKVLAFLLEQFPNFNYFIVGGKLSADEINKENVHYYDSVNAKQMLELMLKSDLAVSAAGQTTYELATVGIPTIAIGIAENQKFNMSGWKGSGFFNEEIWFNDDNLFEKIRRNFGIKKHAQIIKQSDGQGARRIVNKCMIEVSNIDILLELREAKMNDAKLLFDWANDPIMRVNSFNQKNIEWDQHIAWLKNKLDNSNSKIFIATFLGDYVGQIRFDKDGANAIIDFYIAKEFRGKGLGPRLLISGTKKIAGYWKDIENIVGKVKKNNFSSKRAFLKAGFQELEREEINVYMKEINYL